MEESPQARQKLPPWFGFKIGTRISDALTRFVEFMTPAEARIRLMASSYWRSRCLYVVTKLGIPDLLANGPQDIGHLANVLDVDADALDRVLSLLKQHGVFSRDREGRWKQNKVSRLLQSDHPYSQKAGVLFLHEENYEAWANLMHSVKTGGPAFDAAHGTPLFDYRTENETYRNIFDEAMISFSTELDEAIATDYDFSQVNSIVDIGGGRGSLLARIQEKHPSMKCTLFEKAEVLSDAFREQMKSDPLCAKIAIEAGDFFEEVPGDADAYIIKLVVHDWSCENVVKIYESIKKYMKPGSKLLVVEMMVDDSNPLHRLRRGLDIHLLVLFGGKERTKEQHQALLEKAGFKVNRVIETRSLVSIVEAVPR